MIATSAFAASSVTTHGHSDVLEQSSLLLHLKKMEATTIVNGHYSIDSKGTLNFEAWVNVSCYESFSGEIFIHRRDLSVKLDENYKILGVLIK